MYLHQVMISLEGNWLRKIGHQYESWWITRREFELKMLKISIKNQKIKYRQKFQWENYMFPIEGEFEVYKKRSVNNFLRLMWFDLGASLMNIIWENYEKTVPLIRIRYVIIYMSDCWEKNSANYTYTLPLMRI